MRWVKRAGLLKSIFLFLMVMVLAGCYGETAIFIDSASYEVFYADSVDEGDGYVLIDTGDAFRYDGVYADEGLTFGFLSFPVYRIPSWAWVEEATLYLGVAGVYPHNFSVDVSFFLAGFAIPLGADAVSSGGVYYGTVTFYSYDEGNYVAVDVTDMVRDALVSGDSYFQLRLSTSGGGVDFEDGGNNLGTYLVPYIEVTYY